MKSQPETNALDNLIADTKWKIDYHEEKLQECVEILYALQSAKRNSVEDEIEPTTKISGIMNMDGTIEKFTAEY
jgi:hypothetical protein